MSFQEFLMMGKHGFYVWWSYGATFIAIVALFLAFRWYKAKLIKKVKSHAQDKTPKARVVTTETIND